jgi:hypothetical protein
MLNVERFLGSELVAISSHEVIAASVMLWCRAWKQTPAASLTDDDRVLAAFCRLPETRFKKLRNDILRGFIKCSDGRLYHRVLANEATRAYAKKTAFQRKRETDSERLRKWRQSRGETRDETHSDTRCETRFVQEGTGTGTVQGQGRDRDERKKKTAKTSAGASPTSATWNAYSGAYETRYGAPPVRNGKVNGQLAQVVSRLGADESPLVAAWYVSHPNGTYVGSGHCVGMLLRDCEKLRTEWATGRTTTTSQARRSDRQASNTFANLLNGTTHESIADQSESPPGLEHRG